MVLFAENKPINGTARNTLTGTVHNSQLSKAGGCQGESKDAAVLPPSSGTGKQADVSHNGAQRGPGNDGGKERGRQDASPGRAERRDGQSWTPRKARLGSSLLPGSFLGGFFHSEILLWKKGW